MDPALEAPLERFHDTLAAHFGDRLITLAVFGSQVQGRERPESDLDLLLVAQGLPPRRLERQGLVLSLARGVSEALAERVSVIPLTPAEAQAVKPYYLGLLDGCRILADPNGFLAGILERLRLRSWARGA